jgi:hypothetical protein
MKPIPFDPFDDRFVVFDERLWVHRSQAVLSAMLTAEVRLSNSREGQEFLDAVEELVGRECHATFKYREGDHKCGVRLSYISDALKFRLDEFDDIDRLVIRFNHFIEFFRRIQ